MENGDVMNTARSAGAVYLAIIGGVLTLSLTLFAHWPLLGSLGLAIGLMALAALLARATRQRPDLLLPAHAPSPDTVQAAPPAERKEERIADVMLPSRSEDYYFLLSAMVVWSSPNVSAEEQAGMAALAVDAILKRAREFTEQRNPHDVSLVRHELAAVLAETQTDATQRLSAMAEAVQLKLSDDDQQRLDKLAAVRKDEAVWEHERKYEQSKREYLSDDVLKDAGSAVVWWLARNDDQVERTVRDIGLLAQLTSAANNTHIPEAFRQLVPDYPITLAGDQPNGSAGPLPPEHPTNPVTRFDDFLSAAGFTEDSPQRVLFARQVADLVMKHGYAEVGQDLISRFDPIDDPQDLREEEHDDPLEAENGD